MKQNIEYLKKKMIKYKSSHQKLNIQMSTQILHQIDSLIKKQGIPYYYKKWKQPKKIREQIEKYNGAHDYKFCNLLDEYVRTYHFHSFVECQSDQKVKRKIKKNKEVPAYARKYKWMRETFFIQKPMPEISFDNKTKIGKIIFYKFYGSFDQKQDIPDAKKQINMVSLFLKKHEKEMKGLILDFSRHIGGNCWPTIYALQSLLVNVPLFCWSNKKKISNNQKFHSITNKKSNGICDIEIKMIRVTNENNKINCNYPIAIIIGQHTSSSGEILAGSFIGKKGVRSFGKKTKGFLSVNDTIPINSKMQLILTTTFHYLSNGKSAEYLVPDQETNSPITEAREWIINKII